MWLVGEEMRAMPTGDEALRWPPDPLVRHGRIVDAAGCMSLLTRMQRTLASGPPHGAVVVACRPVLATPAAQRAVRDVMAAVFAGSRVLLIDSVRAAAIGSATASGVLLIADIGAQLTEVALLVDGRVVAARRAAVGTHDPPSRGGPRPLAGVVTRLVADIVGNPRMRRLARTALDRGAVVVGDGATVPELTTRLATILRAHVRPADAPRLAALRGAGQAARTAARTAARSRVQPFTSEPARPPGLGRSG
jgi:rod shape-determining protein MreB